MLPLMFPLLMRMMLSSMLPVLPMLFPFMLLLFVPPEDIIPVSTHASGHEISYQDMFGYVTV